MIQDLLSLNWQVFEDVNQPAGHEGVWDPLMRFGAQDVIFLIPLIVLALWVGVAFVLPGARSSTGTGSAFAQARALGLRMVMLAVPAAILAVILNVVIGSIFYEPRPFVSHPGVVHQLVAHAADGSFPSDHEAVAAALVTPLVVYLVLVLRERAKAPAGREMALVVRLAWVLALLGLIAALFIGVARIYVGVHYPGDIIGGALCGAVAGIVVVSLRPLAEPVLEALVQLAERWRLA